MAQARQQGHGFGTAPVFLAGISTILGTILFLRFGYAVAHAGFFGTLLIILIGHAITIPTAMAIAEIATNRKVEGGGEYYIISRSFGPMVGGTIGISLYFSQAISVAFYMIAFSESFRPLFGWLQAQTGIEPQAWMIGVPATVVLLSVILYKGADLGVSALWVVVTILGTSLLFFFMGTSESPPEFEPFARVQNPDDFFIVFAIIFPAFTGMTAGVGLSGDLKNPRRSIPLGTLSATLIGMVVYVLVIWKLASNLTPEQLAADQFAMSQIAIWGPIIPIGLAAATLSSAIGSILIAPRTMQALAADGIFPSEKLNRFLSAGRGDSNEPRHATLVTAVIVLTVVLLGNVDFVAQIISMFFMITYGSLCLVSFLEHFAGNPSYRPAFRSRWYISLIGAIASFVMMFQMAPLYAMLAIVAIILIYFGLRHSHTGDDDLSAMLKGVLFQLTRRLQVLIQSKRSRSSPAHWRPSFIAISSDSFTRLAAFDLLRWISRYYGFGTFIHFIKGRLTRETNRESIRTLGKLIRLSKSSHAGIYVDTIVSPSFRTAVAQIVQIPGIAGMDNNSILFEFHRDHATDISDILAGCEFASYVNFNMCVLRSSERRFGYKQMIHIWLTPGDYRNANLMILLAYIIMGHPEWEGAEVELYAAFEKEHLEVEAERLNRLVELGRIPISRKKIKKIPWDRKKTTYESLVERHSEDADLVILGFSIHKALEEKGAFFRRFGKINDVLFTRAGEKIAIEDDEEENKN